ncbi:MAG: hypothetical protein RL018_1293 [Pseudomonadota bacterium]|jgi:hypothetical protein
MGWFSKATGGVFDPISEPISKVDDAIVQPIVNATKDAGSQLDDFVNNEVPGGWAGVILIGAGVYYAPEIGAYFSSTGAPLTAEQAAAATTTEAGAAGSTGTGLTASGSTGLTAGNTANLSAMGGAQGLTGASTVGTTIGETGGALANGGIGSTIGTLGAAGGAGSALGAAGGAAAGSSLGSMLPYMVGGQVVTGLLQADSAKKAADIQSAAAKDATALQGQMFNTINQQQAPYRTAGYGALNNIGELNSGQYTKYDAAGNPTGVAQGSGYLTHQFDKNDLTNGLAPNYDFMLGQGQMANQRAANMGGGALGGNALQGLNKFTQDYAGNAYQNAFTNYQNQRSNIYNTLAGIAGIGQTGQNATNTAATNATNAASQLGVGSAAAQAAGQVGSTNALANTIGNVGNTYMLSQLLNQSGRVA